MPTKRIYLSSSGDAWDLVRDEETSRVSVRHQPNLSSGGKASEIDVGVFLSASAGKRETVALLEMIGTLVDDKVAVANPGDDEASAYTARTLELEEIEEEGHS